MSEKWKTRSWRMWVK